MLKADFRTPAPQGSVVFVCHAISGEDLRVQRPNDHPQGGPFLGHLVSRAVSHFKLDPQDLIFITDDGLMLDPRDSLTWDDFHTEFFKKIHEEKDSSSSVSNPTLSKNSNEEQVPLAIFFFLKSWLQVPDHLMTNSMSWKKGFIWLFNPIS